MKLFFSYSNDLKLNSLRFFSFSNDLLLSWNCFSVTVTNWNCFSVTLLKNCFETVETVFSQFLNTISKLFFKIRNKIYDRIKIGHGIDNLTLNLIFLGESELLTSLIATLSKNRGTSNLLTFASKQQNFIIFNKKSTQYKVTRQRRI